ncbi:YcgN family cysteine cluster protein [Thorsellia kenyensis]|uniref:UPF0260 protein ACFFIT_03400 n=1 Tax=Thorsellia kenyensis TaxID=1549888 RepID=A0ABV6C862_9GAMM
MNKKINDTSFWLTKKLEEMSQNEWESLCDGCAQCCLHKLIDEDTDEIYFTNVACNQLNIEKCQCSNYENRFNLGEDCIKLTRDKVDEFSWLPNTCAYRLISEGKDLLPWHPLKSGSKTLMHEQKITVKHIAVHEIEVVNWEDHIINHPGN